MGEPLQHVFNLMKTMGRLLLNHLRPQVHHAEDPMQCAYQEKVGVEDAIPYLLHRAHSHLDKGGGAVRVMFFDFSSAFNTIQPLLLRDKLMKMEVDMHLQHRSTTGQGLFFSSLMTLQSWGVCETGQEREYRSLVEDFVEWCTTNTSEAEHSPKPKEMCYRPLSSLRSPLRGSMWRWSGPTNTLVCTWNQRLDWSVNTDTVLQESTEQTVLPPQEAGVSSGSARNSC
ncbi:hypothetical protein NFI96_025341 [Prochilodus magdalenae]|nr:hypothetical protein NFI96_025341 [Prochilodus magdalenae]